MSRTGILIAVVVLLVASIGLVYAGSGALTKAEMQAAVGWEEKCADVTCETCGTPRDECDVCYNGGGCGGYSSACPITGKVTNNESYRICYGTSSSKHCWDAGQVTCGTYWFCDMPTPTYAYCCEEYPWGGTYCEGGKLSGRWCTQCSRSDTSGGPPHTAFDHLCQ